MADFVIKRGDTLPNFKAILTMGDGSAVPIQDAVFTLVLRNQETNQVVRYTGVASTVNAGIERKTQFEYSWQVGDTDLIGEYEAEVEIYYPTLNKTLSVPNYRNIKVEFIPDI